MAGCPAMVTGLGRSGSQGMAGPGERIALPSAVCHGPRSSDHHTPAGCPDRNHERSPLTKNDAFGSVVGSGIGRRVVRRPSDTESEGVRSVHRSSVLSGAQSNPELPPLNHRN